MENSISALLGPLIRVMGKSWGSYTERNISKGEKQPGVRSLFVMCVSKAHVSFEGRGTAPLWEKAGDSDASHCLTSSRSQVPGASDAFSA